MRNEDFIYRNGDNWIDLSGLPRKKYRNKNVINWEKVSEMTVKFKYNDIKSFFILNYSHKDYKYKYVNLFFNGKNKTMNVSNLYKVKLGFFDKKYLSDSVKKVIIDNTKGIQPYSHKKVRVKCEYCGNISKQWVSNLSQRGMYCSKCSNKKTYPERFCETWLSLNDINFIEQHSFKDLKRRRFDFYIPELNTIIEMNGMHHYKPVFGQEKFETSVQYDFEKYRYCKENNINLISVKCVSLNYESIVDSFNESVTGSLIPTINIDFRKHISGSYSDRNKRIIIDYEKGYTTPEIAKKFNMTSNGIASILKKYGVKMRSGGIPKRSVVNINGKVIFNSVSSAKSYCSLARGNGISFCCKGKQKSAGKHPITGEPLKWMYLEDYIEQFGEEGLTYYEEKISS